MNNLDNIMNRRRVRANEAELQKLNEEINEDAKSDYRGSSYRHGWEVKSKDREVDKAHNDALRPIYKKLESKGWYLALDNASRDKVSDFIVSHARAPQPAEVEAMNPSYRENTDKLNPEAKKYLEQRAAGKIKVTGSKTNSSGRQTDHDLKYHLDKLHSSKKYQSAKPEKKREMDAHYTQRFGGKARSVAEELAWEIEDFMFEFEEEAATWLEANDYIVDEESISLLVRDWFEE